MSISFQLDSIESVNRFYKQQRQSSRIKKLDCAYTLRRADNILAALYLQKKSQGWFLRSIFVAPCERSSGLAERLIREALLTINGQPCYCFPLVYLDKLYTRSGFIAADISEARDSVRDQFRRVARHHNITYKVNVQGSCICVN